MNGLKTPMKRGMPAPALPADLAAMSIYGAMPPVDYGMDYPGGLGGMGLNPNSMGGIGFQANGSSIATPNLTGGMGGGGGSGGGWSWLSTRDQQGVLGPALAGAQALGGLYLGMKQYGLAKETLANNKAQFERNFEAQKTTTNASLEDRQRARVASNAGAYQSVGDYMNQNGVR